MKLSKNQIAELVQDKCPWGYYGYGTNLKARNPKPTHKYVQHLKNMRDAEWATPKEICPEVKFPISHEFAQFCRLGLAEKFYNPTTRRVFYRITERGLKLLASIGV